MVRPAEAAARCHQPDVGRAGHHRQGLRRRWRRKFPRGTRGYRVIFYTGVGVGGGGHGRKACAVSLSGSVTNLFRWPNHRSSRRWLLRCEAVTPIRRCNVAANLRRAREETDSTSHPRVFPLLLFVFLGKVETQPASPTRRSARGSPYLSFLGWRWRLEVAHRRDGWAGRAVGRNRRRGSEAAVLPILLRDGTACLCSPRLIATRRPMSSTL